MLRQILVGVAVSVCNIAIHACLTTAVIWAARIAVAISTSRQSFRLITVMIVTVSLLMAAHFAEVLVWSLAYAIVGAAPEGTDLIYFAFVNYTTLGYGDVHSSGALASAGANDGDERRAVVWVVNCSHF